MDFEDIDSIDPYTCFTYACYVLKKPLLAGGHGERIIATDPYYAYFYAKYVIKGRWPLGERSIMKNPEKAFYYARDIIKGRWLEAEEKILSSRWGRLYKELFNVLLDSRLAYYYIKGLGYSCLQCECIISLNPEYSYYYASYLEQRFELGEKTIAQDAWWSFMYAKDVIQGRWPRGEPAIAREFRIFEYYREFLNNRNRSVAQRPSLDWITYGF